ncbi:MAG: Smr/MutS family protein [Pyrinomonadaceae bacterium]
MENPFPEIVALEITDSFDLHSIPPADVRRVTEEYLLLAREKGFRVVRIIHGKGIGVQREIVRKILAETAFVEDYKDAPAFSGHWGATMAIINQH